MVKVALAGASGNVGQEILDALVARRKHDILLLSRKDSPGTDLPSGVTWVKTSYNDIADLAKILEGVETLLSFVIEPNDDPESRVQKNLIDAAIRAGVKRFAPSEWATSTLEHTPWYAYKGEIRNYLEELNKNKKVLEYTLFQPGLFTNYMTYPYKSSKHIILFETPVNFYDRRALLCKGGEDAMITLTTVQDTARIVALAIEYQHEWPVSGGIKGEELTMGQLIALGEEIRGEPFTVEKLKKEDLQVGKLNSSWRLHFTHHSIPPEQRDALAANLVSGFLLGILAGNLNVSDGWNRLLLDYKFTRPGDFLSKAWAAIDAGAKSVYTED